MRAHGGELQQRLLILAPHGLVTTELEQMLESLPDIALTHEVSTGAAALACCAGQASDLILVLTDWSGSGTLADIQRLQHQHPSLGIIVMGVRSMPLRVAAAFGAGARGYVTQEALADLPFVLRLVARGGFGCCSVSARQLMDRIITRQPLSPREQLIAAQVTAGQTSNEIATMLGVKPSTVETHVERILHKIGGLSRIDIATWWQRQMGVVEHDDPL